MISKFATATKGSDHDDYSVVSVTEYLRGLAAKEEGYSGTYLAGTLIIYDPDRRSDEGEMISIDVRDIDEVSEEYRDACFYASMIYINSKPPTGSFYGLATRNIERYKTFKKMDDFLNARNEFS